MPVAPSLTSVHTLLPQPFDRDAGLERAQHGGGQGSGGRRASRRPAGLAPRMPMLRSLAAEASLLRGLALQVAARQLATVHAM